MREGTAGHLDVCGHVTLALALLSEVKAGVLHVTLEYPSMWLSHSTRRDVSPWLY